MTTLSEQSTITRRPVQIQSNFERRAYTFMRLSGIALLILAVGHMLIQHVLNSTANLTIQFVALQWQNWGWKVFDILLLAFAIPHGINGLRNVLEDYIHNETAMTWINRFLLLFVIATLLWAGYAIINFDATPFMD